MKYGVSIDKQGKLEITDRKLERFKPILESCITICVTKYCLGTKYSSREWNIFEDPDFLKGIEKELDSTLDFLIELDIFPEDILDERETRMVEGRVIRSRKFYMVGFPVDYRAALWIPSTKVLLEAVNHLGIRTWSLISCEGCMCYVNLGLIQSRKTMSRKSAIELFDNLVNGPKSINFQTPIYKKEKGFDDTIDTGITVTLNTERLGKYIPLRYILETKNK